MPETADFYAAEALALDLSTLTQTERAFVAAFAAGLTAQANIESGQADQPDEKE